MDITTVEQASEAINRWLDENHHKIQKIDDGQSTFHYEIDYPIGSLKRQRILQPTEFPGLVVLLNGVSIAKEHIDSLAKLSREERDQFYGEVRNDLLFLKNSYDMNMNEEGVAKQIQFSYEFYLDGLSKTKMFEGLLLNHRTLIYIVTKFNDKFGIPEMPGGSEGEKVAQNA